MRSLALALAAVAAATGCSDEDPTQEPSTGATAADERQCAMLTSGLAYDILGTDRVTARGDVLDPKATGEQECRISATSKTHSSISIAIHLGTSGAPTTDTPPADCSGPDVPSAWGYTFACWEQATESVHLLAWPAPDRMIEISVATRANNAARLHAEEAAGELLVDVNEAIDDALSRT